MKFVVLPSQGTMAVDNQVIPLNSASSFSPNTEIVAFNGDKGTGSIEYNDRPRLFDQPADPADYASLVDDWMRAVLPMWNAMGDQAAALQQARDIKTGYVDALYHSKRQAPITVGGIAWNADDESIKDMIDQISTWDVAADAVSAVNNMTISTSRAASNPTVNAALGAIVSRGPIEIGSFAPLPSGQYFLMTTTQVTSLINSISDSNPATTSSKSPIAMAGPGISMTRHGGTAAETRSMAEARQVIGQIAERRNTLNQARAQKKEHFNTRTNIADVISGSATSGW